MEFLDEIIGDFASFVWGLPLIVLLIGGGIYFIIYSKGLPYRHVNLGIRAIMGRISEGDSKETEGQLSPLQSLSTALASTIGMGNIAGVAVAISIGGPGAIFWMWVSGLIGMCTKFFTCTLAVLYRGKDDQGNIQGGPMYVIEKGMGKKFKPLAILFSVACLIGALPVFNVNQLTQALRDILLVPMGFEQSLGMNISIGIFLTMITSYIILGGLSRISRTAERLVPFMVIVYLIAVVIIVVLNASKVPYYMSLIVSEAFNPQHYDGDPFLGGVLGGLVLLGIRRGAFSNEAGIGTAPMAHGAAKTNYPVKEGLIAMLGPFIDTIVVCTLTALSILMTDVWQTSESNGVTLTSVAFENALPYGGQYILLICIISFSVSSLFTFSYYGTKALSYLGGTEMAKIYNYFYLASIIVGATFSLDAIINLIDGFYAIMAFPTMISALYLSPKVVAEAKRFFKNNPFE